jgi:hypothetical protein
VSVAYVLDDGTLLSLITDNLNGGCPRGGFNFPDCLSPHAWGKDTISADIDESKNAKPIINKELFSGRYGLSEMWRSQEELREKPRLTCRVCFFLKIF